MWPVYMQGDGAIVLQPATEDEMEKEKKNLSVETSKRIGQRGDGGVLACHEAYVGGCSRWLGFPRRVVGRLCCRGRSSLLRVLERKAKKLGKSVRGEMVRIRILCSPPSCKWRTFTCHRFGAQLSKSIVTHMPAQIERGSTNTSRRLSHCHTTPVVPHSTAAVR